MSIFKCKMCGGDLDVRDGSTVCECEYCGSVQTTPVLDNDKKTNLFNRANRLRMNSEFDKAAAIYASITAEFPREAEAYWGLCLCKFGIEYVDDPLTGNKIPTCHRTLTTSILDDSDYAQAIQNADSIARPVYVSEAKRIDELQQDILQIVKNESPYDVFICYKETDEYGDRTEDSVIAYEIYEALTAKGLKVFFARVTLEDKLGQQYEPYIFAALQSAKVMLAVGTSYENFDAVWVKNEWSRFLEMAKTDRSKKLIPCFKDIDIDELPRVFQRLQAQDLSKLGWLQDLTRGTVKICRNVDNVSSKGYSTHEKEKSLKYLDRAEVYLEDGLWENARHYSELSLKHETVTSRAYLIKLMTDMHVRNTDELKRCPVLISNNENYKKAIEFANQEEFEELEEIDRIVTDQIKKQCDKKIHDILFVARNAKSLNAFVQIEKTLEELPELPETIDCRKQVNVEKERVLEIEFGLARELMRKGEYAEAEKAFGSLGDYKLSKALRRECNREIEKASVYEKAFSLQQRGYFEAAAKSFQELGEYRDSKKLAKQCARRAKGSYSNGRKAGAVIHIIFAVILVLGIVTTNYLQGVFILLALSVSVIASVYIWKLDRRKSAARIIIDIIVCFVALVVLAGVANARNADKITTSVFAGIIGILTILF